MPKDCAISFNLYLVRFSEIYCDLVRMAVSHVVLIGRLKKNETTDSAGKLPIAAGRLEAEAFSLLLVTVADRC